MKSSAGFYLIFLDSMEGAVNSLQLWFTHLSEETLSALGFMILLVTAALIGFWIYNRRKYQQLAHQIPASVVKNYLDSIIQNSSALKSSLFRGGGLETSEGLSVPSVKPVHDLPTGGGSISSEEYVQKNAELSSLKAQVSDKNQVITELEAKLADATSTTVSAIAPVDSSAEVDELNNEIASLKEKLANATTSNTESESLVQERDELKSRLAEYEIIEDDLANLKKLQQENKQLKAALNGDESSDLKSDEKESVAPLEIAESSPESDTVTEPVGF